jgi:hypothetical protein
LCSLSHEPKVIEDITSAPIVTSFLSKRTETLDHIDVSEEEWDGKNSVHLTISHRDAHMSGQSASRVHSLLKIRVVLQPFITPDPRMTFDLLALISGLQLRIAEASLKQWSVITTQMWLDVFRSSWFTMRNLEVAGQIEELIFAMTSHVDGISREGAYFMCGLENLRFIRCNFHASKSSKTLNWLLEECLQERASQGLKNLTFHLDDCSNIPLEDLQRIKEAGWVRALMWNGKDIDEAVSEA